MKDKKYMLSSCFNFIDPLRQLAYLNMISVSENIWIYPPQKRSDPCQMSIVSIQMIEQIVQGQVRS